MGGSVRRSRDGGGRRGERSGRLEEVGSPSGRGRSWVRGTGFCWAVGASHALCRIRNTVSNPKEPSSPYNATQRVAQQGATGPDRSLRRVDRRDSCEVSGKTHLLLLMAPPKRLRLRQVAAAVVPPRPCRVEREREDSAMDAFYTLHSRQTKSLECVSSPAGLLVSCGRRKMEVDERQTMKPPTRNQVVQLAPAVFAGFQKASQILQGALYTAARPDAVLTVDRLEARCPGPLQHA